MGYTLRPFHPGDAEAIAALTLAAIQVTGLHAYSQEQVTAWSARYAVARLLDGAAKGDVILVAADPADVPAAYAVLEADGHLDMLYCHPDHSGRELARWLLAEAELTAQALDIPRLFTEASELARPVFERAGYTLLQRRDFTIAHEGRDVAIHNYAMEKRLK